MNFFANRFLEKKNLKNSPKNKGGSYERQTRLLGTDLGSYHRAKSEVPISTPNGVIRGQSLTFDPQKQGPPNRFPLKILETTLRPCRPKPLGKSRRRIRRNLPPNRLSIFRSYPAPAKNCHIIST